MGPGAERLWQREVGLVGGFALHSIWWPVAFSSPCSLCPAIHKASLFGCFLAVCASARQIESQAGTKQPLFQKPPSLFMVPNLVQILPPPAWLVVLAGTNNAPIEWPPALCWTCQPPLASPELQSSAPADQHVV